MMNKKPSSQRMEYAKLMNGTTPIFSQFGTDVFASDVVMMCIDSIATECSKLKPEHIRHIEDGMQKRVNGSINRLLRVAPNKLMTTKDFIEKIIWLLYKNFNCFIYPVYENTSTGRRYKAFYPLNPTVVTFMRDSRNRLFVEFQFANGTKVTLPYSDVIHLRKQFSVNDVMGGGMDGQPNNSALLKVIKINDVALQGISKAIKTSLTLRGILKVNMMLDEDKQKEERKEFEQKIENGETGIVSIDLKNEYTPLDIDPKIIDKDTMEFLQNKILFWYGVSLPILSGDFTDEQYQAFYEKTLEPLIISLGQAFTKTLFTENELDFGNEIVFYPQKLLFTSPKNKIAIGDILGNRGALTDNQLLSLFGYPPYEGGNARKQSLNFISVDIANQYQLIRAGKGAKSDEEI